MKLTHKIELPDGRVASLYRGDHREIFLMVGLGPQWERKVPFVSLFRISSADRDEVMDGSSSDRTVEQIIRHRPAIWGVLRGRKVEPFRSLWSLFKYLREEKW